MGLFDFLLFGALINSFRNNHSSNSSHSGFSNGSYDRSYDRGYDDGYMDGFEDHDDCQCHDDYDYGDSCDRDCDGDDFFDF